MEESFGLLQDVVAMAHCCNKTIVEHAVSHANYCKELQTTDLMAVMSGIYLLLLLCGPHKEHICTKWLH